MKEASRLNDMAVERLIPLVNQGMTEQELAEELQKIYLELGAEGYSFEPNLCLWGKCGRSTSYDRYGQCRQNRRFGCA